MLRTLSYLSLALVTFIGLEQFGVIPKAKYFSSMPRPEWHATTAQSAAHHAAPSLPYTRLTDRVASLGNTTQD